MNKSSEYVEGARPVSKYRQKELDREAGARQSFEFKEESIASTTPVPLGTVQAIVVMVAMRSGFLFLDAGEMKNIFLSVKVYKGYTKGLYCPIGKGSLVTCEIELCAKGMRVTRVLSVSGSRRT